MDTFQRYTPEIDAGSFKLSGRDAFPFWQGALQLPIILLWKEKSCLANQLCLVDRRIAVKKVSAVGFTADSRHVVFADKFGDVLVAEVPGEQAESAGHPATFTGEVLPITTSRRGNVSLC